MKPNTLFTLLFIVLLVVACKEERRECDGNHDSHQAECRHNDHHKDQHRGKNQKSVTQLKKELTEAGFQLFDYVDEESGDTVIMQQYFIAFLKRGKVRSQDSLEAARLQEAHLKHLSEMYEKGYADISGPFGDDGDIRGITIYNVPTLEMADSLANMDPSVKAGRLEIEVHPWWAAKGFPLR